jgi:hypothetical protein
MAVQQAPVALAWSGFPGDTAVRATWATVAGRPRSWTAPQRGSRNLQLSTAHSDVQQNKREPRAVPASGSPVS